jgi:hypothetical protein
MRSRVSHLNRYQGTANIQVTGDPAEGRSGGGLFSPEGYVVGVCNWAERNDWHEGTYAAPATIREELDSRQLSAIYLATNERPIRIPTNETSPAPASLASASSAPAFASPPLPGPRPSMPPLPGPAGRDVAADWLPGSSAPLPGPAANTVANNNTAENRTVGNNGADNNVVRASAETPVLSSAMSPTAMPAHEQAALGEIRRYMKEGAEIVCIVRPRGIDGKSQVIILDHASPEVVKRLSELSTENGNAGSASEHSEKQRPVYTSLELTQPRRVLLEWSSPAAK